MSTKNCPAKSSPSAFERQAEERQSGLVGELLGFVMANKKWWMIPILVMVLVLGLIVFLGGTAAAPFIYTLF
jgi:hypothetical protein